jgi:hypothetical protein
MPTPRGDEYGSIWAVGEISHERGRNGAHCAVRLPFLICTGVVEKEVGDIEIIENEFPFSLPLAAQPITYKLEDVALRIMPSR